MKNDSSQGLKNVKWYVLLTFGISWIIWLPFVLAGFGLYETNDVMDALLTPAVVIAAFAPMISAVILVYKDGNKTALKAYFKRVLNFKIKPVYYIVALIVPLLTTMIAHYATNITGLDVLPNNLFPEGLSIPVFVLVIPYFLFILVFGGGQEEFGWRGYAQDPLQAKFGIVLGSIILGVIWGLWHLPLWFIEGEGHSYYSFIAFFLYVVSISLIIGILYNASGKKMVIPWVFHTMGNVAVPFFPVLFLADVPQPGYWVWVGVNIVTAVLFVVYYSRPSAKLLRKQES